MNDRGATPEQEARRAALSAKARRVMFLRAGWHGLVLTGVDIAGIAAGAVAAHAVTGSANQVWLQVPVAAVLSVALFCGWMALVKTLRVEALQAAGVAELWLWLLASLLWNPVVLLPLHYLTQGYLTGFGNVVALAIHQLLVNAVALFGPWGPGRRAA